MKPKAMTTSFSQIQQRNKAQFFQQLIFHRSEAGSATLPVFRSNLNMSLDHKIQSEAGGSVHSKLGKKPLMQFVLCRRSD